MKCNQIQFTYRNRIWFMLWEILTDETDRDRVMEYIREKIYKPRTLSTNLSQAKSARVGTGVLACRVSGTRCDREELRKVDGGWQYAVYEE